MTTTRTLDCHCKLCDNNFVFQWEDAPNSNFPKEHTYITSSAIEYKEKQYIGCAKCGQTHGVEIVKI